ncbi:MAG: hypothetical protein PHT33_08745 [bacterium]|nr:hypothetical protein [bacterium]
MIIDYDKRPERQLYYLGSRLIEVIKDMPDHYIELLDAFELMNRNESVSMNTFMLTMDWLFLLGVIAYDEGRIIKCF